MNKTTEKEILNYFLNKNIQISKNALEILALEEDPINACEIALQNLGDNFVILAEHLKQKTKPEIKTNFKIIKNYEEKPIQSNIQSISTYFNSRYAYFRKQMQWRLSNLISIGNVRKNNNGKNNKISIIGIVTDKKKTLKGNVIIDVEDPTGQIRAIATKENIINQSESVVLDEVIGLSGSLGDSVLFVDDITWPDFPAQREFSALKEDIFAAFLSDTHIGSKKFLKNDFNNMVEWIQKGSDTHINTEKIKYLFIAGDLVDGVGVYPNQVEELEIKDIYNQYAEAAKILSKIPSRIQIIISPGNHDYVRIAQPQPILPKDVAKELYELENVTMVSNPAIINIQNSNESNLNILVYHGVSIDTMVSSDPTLKDGYKHPEKVMCSLLKKRHLSPQYDSGLVTSEDDFLLIPENIDVFHAGHVHSNGALNYKGVTIINSGTWQEQTDFQKLCGHEPTPGKLPLLNLKTRELHQIDFQTSKIS